MGSGGRLAVGHPHFEPWGDRGILVFGMEEAVGKLPPAEGVALARPLVAYVVENHKAVAAAVESGLDYRRVDGDRLPPFGVRGRGVGKLPDRAAVAENDGRDVGRGARQAEAGRAGQLGVVDARPFVHGTEIVETVTRQSLSGEAWCKRRTARWIRRPLTAEKSPSSRLNSWMPLNLIRLAAPLFPSRSPLTVETHVSRVTGAVTRTLSAEIAATGTSSRATSRPTVRQGNVLFMGNRPWES